MLNAAEARKIVILNWNDYECSEALDSTYTPQHSLDLIYGQKEHPRYLTTAHLWWLAFDSDDIGSEGKLSREKVFYQGKHRVLGSPSHLLHEPSGGQSLRCRAINESRAGARYSVRKRYHANFCSCETARDGSYWRWTDQVGIHTPLQHNEKRWVAPKDLTIHSRHLYGFWNSGKICVQSK